MPVELRKRKAPPPPPEPPAKKQTKPKATKAAAAPKAAPVTEKVTKAAAKAAAKATETVKETATKATKAAAAAAKAAAAAEVAAPNGADAKKPEVGDVISLEGFGGEVETNDGDKTTLKALVDESKAGVVLFTYPKASTPGCTRQVCFFRDSYEPFTAAGFAIYGLSGDSPKANTTFKDKQKLQYSLLCDPSFTLIGAIGLKKAPKGTTRGVFVVDKSGKVLAAQPGSPEGTLNVVKKLVEELGGDDDENAEEVEEKEEPAKEEAKDEEKKDEEAKPNGEAASGETTEKTEEKKVEDDAEKKVDDDEVLPDAPPVPAAEEAEKEDKEEKE